MIGADSPHEPKYAHVKAWLLRQIEDGELRPGERIPPEPELMRRHGVSRATVRRALADLIHAGYLRAEQGRGTFVQTRGQPLAAGRRIAVCYHGSRADIHNPHHYRIMHSVQETVGAAGYDVVTTTWDVETDRHGFTAWVRERGIAGVVLIGGVDGAAIGELEASGVPLVLADADVADTAVVAVKVNFVRAAAALTAHLVELGHRRFGLIVPPDRGEGMGSGLLEGFAQVQRRAPGVGAVPTVRAIPDVRAGHDTVAAWLAAPERPTAVLCGADLFALGAYQAVQSRGLRVPDDLSVVGTGNLDIGQHLLPPLTTFARPAQRMGLVAGEKLLAMLAGLPIGPAKVWLDAQPILRESCAAAPDAPAGRREGRPVAPELVVEHSGDGRRLPGSRRAQQRAGGEQGAASLGDGRARDEGDADD